MLVGKLGGLVRLFAVDLAVVWISAGRGCCGFGVGGLVVVLVGELRALADSVRWFVCFWWFGMVLLLAVGMLLYWCLLWGCCISRMVLFVLVVVL